MRNCWHLCLILLIAVGVWGCRDVARYVSTSEHKGETPQCDVSTQRVALLRGPSVIALADWLVNPPQIGGQKVSVQVFDAPDRVQAALIKGEADVAMLPMISAANLYNKGVALQLLGCPIWGTLYVVERQPIAANTPLHLFGSGTTPDILARHYLKQQELDYPLNYTLRSAQEVTEGLLAGRVDRAVLGEPFLSLVLRKDSSLHIVADLNRLSPQDSISFAQTAIVCTPEAESYRQELYAALRRSCAETNTNPELAIQRLEEQQLFAPGALTAESVRRCRIDFREVTEVASSIEAFLRLIYSYEPRALGGKLPDAGFISPAP
ncbi:MAG: ABC transporter substrate-binding protein [Parabacteroides sp.]